MKIRGEQDITGEFARDLRKKMNLSQREFWDIVGVCQSSGHKFESGVSNMARSLRILFYAAYVAGLHLDASTPEGVKEMARLVKLQRKA